MTLLDHKRMPTVATLMQPFPYFAELNDSVARILELMHDHNIRHIPIKQGDRVIGIISERDLRWMKSPAIVIPAADEIPVHHVMTYNPYVVDINTPLTTVISRITKEKIGAAIVTSSGRLAGIVTVIDLCRALAELLDTEFSAS
ncbi:HPP family protein [Pleurocapsa sp. PCC 7319]|uniref:CBS domain-containing protein n=1 Tax=Pleurocapsa sp. PCC 7319 TaxID=118161 RepID=UPI00118177AC|nr:CBS domain-containing protein [Pleurocapsa sp. PCC 7319]